MDELALDHCFWRAMSGSDAFRTWVISKTKFKCMFLDFVRDEKWHQRWYRDPQTRKDSETDILLMFSDPLTTLRYALHIEHKTLRGKWEPDQAENYRKRAIDRSGPWRYIDHQIVLLAPQDFISRYSTEAGHFDLTLTYEDVSRFIPEFATAV